MGDSYSVATAQQIYNSAIINAYFFHHDNTLPLHTSHLVNYHQTSYLVVPTHAHYNVVSMISTNDSFYRL